MVADLCSFGLPGLSNSELLLAAQYLLMDQRCGSVAGKANILIKPPRRWRGLQRQLIEIF